MRKQNPNHSVALEGSRTIGKCNSMPKDSLENFPEYNTSNLERGILLSAFLMPAIIVGAARIAEASSELGAPPTTMIALAVVVLWIIFACLPPFRPTLIETGGVLVSRLSFPLFLVVAAISGILTTADSGGRIALMVSSWALMLAIAGAIRAWRSNRRLMVFQSIMLGLNIIFLVLLDILVGVYVLPERSHDNVSVVHEPVLGWKLRPNLSIKRGEEGRAPITETINSLGFRSREWTVEKPPDTLRIIVLGDSHTEAYEVNDGETWHKLLERELGKKRAVEIIPFGVGGWSTDQQLLAYLYYARQFDPDLVILQMTANDIAFNVLEEYWRGKKPWFERHGEVLVLQGVPTPNFRNTGLFSNDLLSKSSLLLWVEAILRQQNIERAVMLEADMDEAWRVTELLIRDLKSMVESDGARLITLMANAHHEYEAQIKGMLKRQGVPYLETRDAYSDEFDSYWQGGHWNQKGQRAVANRLLPQLEAYLPEGD